MPQVLGDDGIVGRDVGERLCGKRAPTLQRHAAPAQLIEDRGIVGGIGEDRDRLKVLRGGANHRRPANVDLLHRVRQRHRRVADRGREWVQIGGDEVDRRDPVPVELR